LSERTAYALRPPLSSAGPAFLTGLAVGTAAVAVLTVSKVWAVLLLGGLAVGIGAFLSRQWKHYWIAIFLSTIPFNVTKLVYFEPEDVAALKRHYKILVNENLVPQLYISDLPFLVLLAIWLGELLTRRSRLRVPREMALALAFLAWCLFTLIDAPAPFLGLVWAFYEIKMILVLLWLVNASLTRSSLRVVVASLVAALALQAAITVINYRWQLGPEIFRRLVSATETRLETRRSPERGTGTDYVYEKGALLRGTGAVGAGNAQAKFFVVLLPLALASCFLAPPGLIRLLCLSCFGLGAVALYLTYSRGGLLTGLLGTGLLVFLRYRAGYVDRKSFVALAVSVAVVAGAALPLFVDFLTSRPGYFRIRLDHLDHGFRFAAENPLTGVGVNNFNVAVRESDHQGIFDTMPIHNHYLRLFIETGALGLLLQLSFLLVVLRQAYRLIRAPDPFLATVAMAALAGVAAILVYWADDIFYDVILRTQFWILLGLILVIRRLAAEQEETAASSTG
jgi:O-antigen ligase